MSTRRYRSRGTDQFGGRARTSRVRVGHSLGSAQSESSAPGGTTSCGSSGPRPRDPCTPRTTGGMVTETSSVRSARSSSTFPLSNAAVTRATISCSATELGAGGSSRSSVPTRRSCNATRARFSALSTDASVASIISAASLALKPRTSRSTSATRCRGGSSWRTVMNASDTDSLDSYRASGPGLSSGSPSRRMSGYGSSHTTSPARFRSGGALLRDETNSGRRLAARSMFRQWFVAMR